MPCNVFLVEDSGKGASVLLTTSVYLPSSALGRPPCAHAGREERVPTLMGAVNKDVNHEFTKKKKLLGPWSLNQWEVLIVLKNSLMEI